jgi:hypothetical protein
MVLTVSYLHESIIYVHLFPIGASALHGLSKEVTFRTEGCYFVGQRSLHCPVVKLTLLLTGHSF